MLLIRKFAKDVPAVFGFFVLVVDPAAFGGGLAEAARGLAADARGTAPAAGVEGVRAPGDRARQVREERLAGGIPISARRWEALARRLRACGVDLPAAPPED